MSRAPIALSTALIAIMIAAPAQPAGVEDDRTADLLTPLLQALLIADEDASARAVVPLVHRSLLDKQGTGLRSTVRDYSFKKAHQNAHFYQLPVRVTRVRPGNLLTIGFRDTAERGRIVSYFIAKKPGVAGPPAPIAVFVPNGGGPVRVSDMGSL